MKIQIKRGEESRRKSQTFDVGEPVLVTDTKRLYIGDGVTPGGFPLGTMYLGESAPAGSIAVFKDASGRIMKGMSKADLLQGYLTETQIANKIALTAPDIKVKTAARADYASNAGTLNGHNDYLRHGVISDDTNSNTSATVASSRALKLLRDALTSSINAVKSSVTALTQRVNSLSSSLTSTKSDVTKVDGKVNTLTGNFNAHVASYQKTAVNVFNQGEHLKRLPGRIDAGTHEPGGGSDGDVYIQYS